MRTKKEKLIKAIERIAEINEAAAQVRRLESEKSALKSYVLSEMKSARHLEAGEYIALVSESVRTSLDKESLIKAGVDLSLHEIKTPVISLSVKSKAAK